MSLHDWERLPDEENEDPFARPSAPDMVGVWRCRKCGWVTHATTDAPDPEPSKKYFRRLPGEEAQWFDCEEVVVLSIMES